MSCTVVLKRCDQTTSVLLPPVIKLLAIRLRIDRNIMGDKRVNEIILEKAII